VPPRLRLALLAICLLCLLPASAQATRPGPNGPIVYVSGPGFGDAPLVIRSGSGSVSPPLATGLNKQHRHPSWSPDRTKIVFAEGTGGVFDIYILDLTQPQSATNPQNLTNSAGVSEDRPAWSPDGTRIAYDSGNDIIVHPVAGGADVNMTSTLAPKAFKAAWSPDMQTLYYSVGDTSVMPNGTNNDIKIFQQPADNSSAGSLLLHFSGVHVLKPAISPDGTKLCYGTSETTGSAQSTTQAVLAAPLSAPASFTIIRDSGLGDYNCTWSPDGTKVAYAEGFGNNAELFARNANGTGTPDNLSNTPGKFDGNPDWAPDPPPSCADRTAPAPFNGFVTVRLSCTDTPDPPFFGQNDPDPEIVTGPAHGVLGSVSDNGSVTYTPNTNFQGTDTFTYKGNDGTSDSPVATVTLHVTPLRCGHKLVTILGTSAAESIVGTNGRDVIAALGGRDKIKGRRGNDVICGGRANDSIGGGKGKDTIFGNKGNDSASGDSGRDKVDGGKGKDKLKGNSSRDVVSGNAGRDRLDGGSARDKCRGGSGRDKAKRCEIRSSIP
jgi:Ca2+-binding RTX toxin-like protein